MMSTCCEHTRGLSADHSGIVSLQLANSVSFLCDARHQKWSSEFHPMTSYKWPAPAISESWLCHAATEVRTDDERLPRDSHRARPLTFLKTLGDRVYSAQRQTQKMPRDAEGLKLVRTRICRARHSAGIPRL